VAAVRPLNNRARRAVVWAAALAATALCARLGWWQLDRADQKLALQAAMQQRADAPPLPASQLADLPDAAAGQVHRRSTLRGRWLGRHTVYLDNRPMAGRQGFVVVTPLLLPDGDAVLVQRGWAPRDFQDRSRLPPLATPDGEVLVPGRLAPPPSRLLELGADPEAQRPGPIRQNLDPVAFAAELGLRLRPLSLQQTGPSRPAAEDARPLPDDGLLRQWPMPALDVGKHHGYAFQWFALAALIAGLTGWFQLLRPWRQARSPNGRTL